MTRVLDMIGDNVRELRPYQPGKPVEELERELGITGALKIASNENPLGPSPAAIEAACAAVAGASAYPDGGCFALRRALAERRGVAPEELVFGAGSNELVYLIVNALCVPGRDEVLTHQYAFVSYRLAARSAGVEFREVLVDPDTLGCDVDALVAAVTERTRVVFVANPNNPTGAYLSAGELERLIDGLPEHVALVVDEAYHEYASAMVDDYPSSARYRERARCEVITTRTFSKAYGLAGMRVGYGIGSARAIDIVDRVRRPFNINSIAQAAALAALDDTAHVERSVAVAKAAIAQLREQLGALGVRVYPSVANFVLVDIGREPEPFYEALLRAGVIVRPMTAWGLAQHVRVSIAEPAHVARVVAAFGDVLG